MLSCLWLGISSVAASFLRRIFAYVLLGTERLHLDLRSSVVPALSPLAVKPAPWQLNKSRSPHHYQFLMRNVCLLACFPLPQ